MSIVQELGFNIIHNYGECRTGSSCISYCNGMSQGVESTQGGGGNGVDDIKVGLVGAGGASTQMARIKMAPVEVNPGGQLSINLARMCVSLQK